MAIASTNTGHKKDINSFAKVTYALPKWQLYADAQVRRADFRYDGSIDLGSVSWTFFNPKLGARRDLGHGFTVYGAIGRATREPARNDLLAGEDNVTVFHELDAVKPERVTDYELGTDWTGRRASVTLNVYSMEFRDEIALTGELSDIGLPLRRNVDRSFRRGVELDARFNPIKSLRLLLTANLSRNRIREWTQFYDVYAADGSYATQESQVFRNVEPLLTPDVVVNPAIEWQATDALNFAVQGRYSSRSWLDNTNAPGFETPSFWNTDLAVGLELKQWIAIGEPRLRLQVNNLFDNKRIWPSGYSYLYFQQEEGGGQTLVGTPSFYPQATRTFFLSLEFKH